MEDLIRRADVLKFIDDIANDYDEIFVDACDVRESVRNIPSVTAPSADDKRLVATPPHIVTMDVTRKYNGVIEHETRTEYRCPHCSAKLFHVVERKYCGECGQAIFWGDDWYTLKADVVGDSNG